MIKSNNKCAVLLYGYMRTYQTTAPALIKNILKPNQADLFIYTNKIAGISAVPLHTSDINTIKRKFGEQQDQCGDQVTAKSLQQAYGTYLKDYRITSFLKEKFIKDSQKATKLPNGIPIERVYSLYYNINQVMDLFLKYCKKNGTEYDTVILARPDLMFYSYIDTKKLDLTKLNISSIGGNLEIEGRTPVYYAAGYKNVERAEYIPWETVAFSDQFIISSFVNMKKLADLYKSLPLYDSYGLPTFHPETIMYYHLGYSQNKEVILNNFQYEILRSNFIAKENSFTRQCNNIQIAQTKYHKYKDKTNNDIRNIKKGFESIFKLPMHFIKYICYKISYKD